MMWGRRITGIGVAGALCLALAACGGSGSSGSAVTSPRGAGSRQPSGQMAKFAACLKQHGVSIPAQTGSGAPPQVNPQDQSFSTAMADCQSFLPAGAPQGAPGSPG